MIKQAYIKGFIDKCRQHGVDARRLIKRAADDTVPDIPESDMSRPATISANLLWNPTDIGYLLASGTRDTLRRDGYLDDKGGYTRNASNEVARIAPDWAKIFQKILSYKNNLSELVAPDGASILNSAANTNLWPLLKQFNRDAYLGDIQDAHLKATRAAGESFLVPKNTKARTPKFVFK